MAEAKKAETTAKKTKQTPKNFWEKIAILQEKNIIVPKNGSMKYGAVNFKYALLDDILEKYKPILGELGLIFYSEINIDEGKVISYLRDTESENFIKSEFRIQGQKAQDFGAWITYGKRYNIGALLSIATDEDIDGPQGENNTGTTAKPPKKKELPKATAKKVSPKQIEFIEKLYSEYEDLKADNDQEATPLTEILKSYKVEKIADLSMTHGSDLIAKLTQFNKEMKGA